MKEALRAAFDYHPDGFLLWKVAPQGRRVGDRAGTLLSTGYTQIKWNYRKYQAHRLIWAWHFGNLPEYLDHIDRNKSNNRIENLRPATLKQNAGNVKKRAGTTSRWRGVHWCRTAQRWVASIQDGPKKRTLGKYETENEAAWVYNQAASTAFGEFANLNRLEEDEHASKT